MDRSLARRTRDHAPTAGLDSAPDWDRILGRFRYLEARAFVLEFLPPVAQ